MKSKKFAFLWHNPDSGNLGCSALAIANTIIVYKELIKKYGDCIKIDLFGDKPEKNKDGLIVLGKFIDSNIEYQAISIRQIPKMILQNPFKVINFFKDYEYVFDISAGDSFTDIYGYKRFLSQFFYKFIATCKSKLILCPQTIGPFNKYYSKILSKYIIQKSFFIYTRDKKSTSIINKIRNNNYCQTTDVAFNLPYSKQSKINKTIGLNISGLLLKKGYTGYNQFNLSCDYKTLILELINFLKRHEWNIILIPHVISSSMNGYEDDYSASQIISKDTGVKVCQKFSNPIEAKNFISSLDLLIGSRMHATIAAISSDTAVIPLSYSIKFESLFTSLGYHHTINLKDKNTEEILEQIYNKINNLTILSNDAIQANKKAKSLINKYITNISNLL